MRPVILFILLLSIGFSSQAQKQGNIWYFGEKAGLDFTSGSVVAITNSGMNTIEGCATICDRSGNLLFYTNGDTVWDASHDTMFNGYGLFGYRSATQSCIIVPKPGNCQLYYIFTSDGVTYDPATQQSHFPNDSIFGYSIVDMSMNGGLGAVTTKNVKLFAPVNETVTAAMHANGYYVWIVAKKLLTNEFYAYLLKDTGVAGPIISAIGSAQQEFPVSYLKFSPNGKRIAFASSDMEIFDFDNSTGVVSNMISLGNGSGAYGFSFSPNSNLLYVSSGQFRLLQYDLLAGGGNAAAIIASKDTIYEHWFNNYFGWAIQNAPDGKMYITKNFLYDDSLGVINDPNVKGAGCNYNNIGIYLAGKFGVNGLPNFVESYYDSTFLFAKPVISYTAPCFGDSTGFGYNISQFNGQAYWDFGDTASGLANNDTIASPNHLFTATGSYLVTLIVTYPCYSDTVQTTITIDTLLQVYIGADKVICFGDSILLDAGIANGTYLWSTGATSQTINVSATGTYSVLVSFGICSGDDTMALTVNAAPIVDLGMDTILCEGDSLILDAGNPSATHNWSTGDTTQTITVSAMGAFAVIATIGSCVAKDTILVNITPPILVDLGPDTSFCEGNTVLLDAGNPGTTYLWSTGDTMQTLVVTSTGNYSVIISVGSCTNSDQIVIIVNPLPLIDLGNDTSICTGTSIMIDAGNSGSNYQWSTGETEQLIKVFEEGIYSVTVNKNGCSDSDTILLFVDDCPDKACTADLFIPNAFTPNNDNQNDILYVMGNNFELRKFIIYSRWGEKLYESNDISEGWDGTYRGNQVNPGVFVYHVEIICANKLIVLLEGDVTLIR